MNIDQLPKVELHCHLDGIVSPIMVNDILREHPDFPMKPSDFTDVLPVYDLQSFFDWWRIIKPIEGDLTYFRAILKQYIASLKRQNVTYFELMIAAGELPSDISLAIADLHAFRTWVDSQEANEIQVEFLIALNRRGSLENLRDLGNLVIALYEQDLICGVAFAGPEIGNPVKPHHKLFARLHEAGMGIEIHAGEWLGSESVWDALNYGFPDRIGHGVTLFEDEKLMEIFQERQIHIEMCPTSNVKTGSVDTIEEHPIRQALELGLNFSINTDDPGVFECSMTDEYRLLATTFGFTEQDYARIYENSLKARFKTALKNKIDTKF